MKDSKSAYSQLMSPKIFDITAERMISIMNKVDAAELGIMPLDRAELKVKGRDRKIVTVVDVTKTMVKPNQIGLFKDVKEELRLKKGDTVRVTPVPKPASLDYIKKKLDGQELNQKEINEIVKDLEQNNLSETEASAFVAAVYIHGYTLAETVAMTKALAAQGEKLRITKKPVVDKHCIGGTNGRTTMIIVPIIASAGCYTPKTSSRSITSAAGTADAMETLANVSLSAQQIKRITEKTGGVIAWGGALDLAPVDDKIIKIEHPFSLDPTGQIIASVMAKKASVGSKYLAVDIPVGPDTKIETTEKAEEMAKLFKEVGKQIGIKVEVLITDGTQPNGMAFGPALEAKYVMQILEGQFFDGLAEKSCELAGTMLELSGKAKKGKGYTKAKEIVQSGKALKKMQEIIRAQGAKTLKSTDIKESKLWKDLPSKQRGKVDKVNVKKCSSIARMAGAPADKKAGAYLYIKEGDMIKKGQPLMRIYSSNRRKLKLALRLAENLNTVEVEKSVIEKI